jgi:DMSO/TMAO reductase YedYZ molybdopterin-dependent catalytic subunit
MSQDDDSKRDRVVKSRLGLRDRFLRFFGGGERAAGSEAGDRAAGPEPERDPEHLGSGPLNRHGRPRLPIGQHETKNWPVLDLGHRPRLTTARWRLTLGGAVDQPAELDWASFQALPQVDDVSDFHCVTTWSKFDMPWRGVRFSTLMELCRPHREASHVMCHAADGYSTNLPLCDALAPDVLLVHTWEGRPLPEEHGGPVRMITPRLYAWKGAKWINRIEVLVGDRPGFWERRGYSNTGDPWKNDRYSAPLPLP